MTAIGKELETKRRRIMVGIGVTAVGSAAAGVAALVCLLSGNMAGAMALGAVFALGMLYCCTQPAKTQKKFVARCREVLIEPILKKHFTELELRPDSGLPRESLEAWAGASLQARYRSGGLISGKYKGSSFKWADVTLTPGQPGAAAQKAFHGRCMAADAGFASDRRLLVRSRGFGEARRRAPLSVPAGMERAETGDQAFDQHFELFCEGQVVFSPRFMQGLVKLAKQTEDDLFLCVGGGHICFGIDTGKTCFEPALVDTFKEERFAEEANIFVRQTIAVLELFKQGSGIFAE